MLLDRGDAVQRPHHPVGEQLRVEVLSYRDGEGAVAVMVPASGLADRHHNGLVHQIQLDHSLSLQSEQIARVVHVARAEGDSHLLASRQRLVRCISDLIHRYHCPSPFCGLGVL